MKKTLLLLLTVLMIISSVSVVCAENIWSNASDWAINDITEANSLGLFPDCLKNTDLTKKITRAEQAALAVKIYEVVTGKIATPAENPFTDTQDEEVLKALNLGVTSGISATTFEPDSNLTREQAATMLSRIYKKVNLTGWTLATDSKFKFEFDMPQNFNDHSKISSWAEQSVYFMASKQWILGNEKKEFMPLDNCSREQALIIAKRMTTFLKNSFKVVCIGSTYTCNSTRWTDALDEYFKEKMPDKNVIVMNAGIAETGSDFGAMRFNNNVVKENPDLVIIDFTPDDMGKDSSNQQYVESMLRQCMNAKKVPGVVMLHTAYPVTEDDELFKQWKDSFETKEALANHYGIQSVNVFEYMKEQYVASNSEKSFGEWLSLYFNQNSDGTYSTKAKPRYYTFIGDTIINAFNKKGLDTFLKPIENKPLFDEENCDIATKRYEIIPMTDERINYSIGMEMTSVNNRFKGWKEYEIPESYYSYPYFPEGIAFLRTNSLSFSFKSAADAIYVCYLTIVDYSVPANIFVDDEKVGSMTTKDEYVKDRVSITSRFEVGGFEEEEKKNVTLKTTSGGGFRVCAIIEEFSN